MVSLVWSSLVALGLLAVSDAKDCTYGGKSYPPGATIPGRGILYKCGANGRVQVIGCMTKSGVQVPKGQIIFADGNRYKCTGWGNMHYLEKLTCRDPTCKAEKAAEGKKPSQPKSNAQPSTSTGSKAKGSSSKGVSTALNTGTGRAEDQCRKNGQVYDKGQYFVANGFKFLCQDLGAYKIISCVSPNGGVEVAIDTVVNDCGWVRNCSRSGPKVSLKESYNSAMDDCKPKQAVPAINRTGSGTVTGFSQSMMGATSAVGQQTSGKLVPTGVSTSRTATMSGTPLSGITSADFRSGCYNNRLQKVPEGQTWQRGIKQFKCEGGKAVLKGCLRLQGGTFVPLNGEVPIGGNMVAYCRMVNGNVAYGEKPKGS